MKNKHLHVIEDVELQKLINKRVGEIETIDESSGPKVCTALAGPEKIPGLEPEFPLPRIIPFASHVLEMRNLYL